MLDDLRKKMLQKEQEIQKRIEALLVESASADEAIRVKINGQHQVVDLQINLEKIDSAEMLEDLLIARLNTAHQEINEKTAALMRSNINDMLPPGLDKIFG